MAPWTFLHIADLQPGSPRSFRYRPAWRDNWETAQAQIAALQPELLLVGGDLTADGWLHGWELAEVCTELDALPCSWHAVPGNMDTGNKHTDRNGAWWPERRDVDLNVTSAQLQRFAGIAGPLQWSFVHRQVRFSGFFGAVAGSGLPEEAAMWRWLEGLAVLPCARYHVMLMHYALFLDRPGEPSWDIADPDQYLPWYFTIDAPHRRRMLDAFHAAGVTEVISGHIHCRRRDLFEDIVFQKAPALCFPQMAEYWSDAHPALGFLHYEVADAGLSATFVPLARFSRRQGYGPSGHPRPDQIDTSLAWEPPPDEA